MYILLIKYFYLFFIGASLGSFYKTLYDRILYFFYSPARKQYSLKEKYKKLFLKPSFCYNCNNKIPYKYLIPVFGFFITGRKCYHCQFPLSLHYFLWEISGGLLLCYFYYFYDIFGFLYVLIIFHFLISGLIDFKKFFLDYENIIFIYIWGFLINHINSYNNLYDLLLKTGLFIFIFLLLFIIGKGKKFGFGDIILIGAISITFNIPEILIIINIGALGSIFYIFFYKKNRNAYAPLGFFLSLASIVILVLKPLDIFEFFSNIFYFNL
ncbi:MAG: hypothetical protein KatS3mg129_1698 [Leptospiraceae bacterium]|nr:MAG: hypothetical protein KatS3mg129_1698 [Leptospiraceae bacterium]